MGQGSKKRRHFIVIFNSQGSALFSGLSVYLIVAIQVLVAYGLREIVFSEIDVS